jgi:hypothetical protein
VDKQQITSILRSILDRSDVESDSMINRKKSPYHTCDIELLLEHISLLVLDLRFNAEASRRELIETNRLLEE